MCQEIYGAEARRTGYNTNISQHFSILVSTVLEDAERNWSWDQQVWMRSCQVNTQAGLQGRGTKSKPNYMKSLVWTEPLPRSTGPILCCYPDRWLLPKLSTHLLWQSVCRKGDFPWQVLVTSEEWETGKTCTWLLGHFGAFCPSSKAKEVQARGRLSALIFCRWKATGIQHQSQKRLDPAKGLHHGSHSPVTALWVHLLG